MHINLGFKKCVGGYLSTLHFCAPELGKKDSVWVGSHVHATEQEAILAAEKYAKTAIEDAKLTDSAEWHSIQ